MAYIEDCILFKFGTSLKITAATIARDETRYSEEIFWKKKMSPARIPNETMMPISVTYRGYAAFEFKIFE